MTQHPHNTYLINTDGDGDVENRNKYIARYLPKLASNKNEANDFWLVSEWQGICVFDETPVGCCIGDVA